MGRGAFARSLLIIPRPRFLAEPFTSSGPQRHRRLVAVGIVTALVVGACSGGSSPSTGPSSAESATSQAVDDDAPAQSTSSTSSTRPATSTTPVPSRDLDPQIEAFLEDPSTAGAHALAVAMGESGDPRWGGWLLDLLRVAGSSSVTKAGIEALSALSGREHDGPPTTAHLTFGSWWLSAELEPGPGYRPWKLALFGDIDTEFARLLDSVPDDLTLSQILWGGVSRGGIPELNDQARIPAAEADWMEADELVLGVVVDGQAVAYPVRILGHHELANDTVGDTPISLVYCTLCRTALVFDRRVDGQILDFETSGLLHNSNKVMVDRQTDTLWRHLTGTGIGGPLAGIELDQYPVVTSLWADWLDQHPDTETLTFPKPIFFVDQPERPPIAYDYKPGAAYRYYYESDQLIFPIVDTPDVFPIKTVVLGIEIDESALAVEVDALLDGPPRWFWVGDHPVVIVPTGAGGPRLRRGASRSGRQRCGCRRGARGWRGGRGRGRAARSRTVHPPRGRDRAPAPGGRAVVLVRLVGQPPSDHDLASLTPRQSATACAVGDLL